LETDAPAEAQLSAKASFGRIRRLSALPEVLAPSILALKIPPKCRSGLLVHKILVLQKDLLDRSPIVCDVGLAIQRGIFELAPVIFVFGSPRR
jgi:hypothetical protein